MILEEHLPRVFEYIGGEIRAMKGIPFIVGGRPDHIHCLTTLPKTMPLSDFIMNIKKGASKWIKNIDNGYRMFAWQDGYGAFSVSYTNKDRVVNYIANQKQHHSKKSFQEEYIEFFKSNNIEYEEKYL